MKHIQKFDEYNNINEEISLFSSKKRLKNLFNDSFKIKQLEDLKPSIDLTFIKTIFSKVCDIIGGEARVKGVQDVIKQSNVYVVDSMLTSLKSMKKDLDDNRELIGWITYDKEENKFRYHSYYN